MFQTAFQPTAFQNDAFQIVITPPTPSGPTGGDGWTADQESRKAFIRDQIDPKQNVSKRKQNKVESNQAVSVDTSTQLANIDRYIANLEKQQQDLQTAVAMRAAKLRLEQELAVLEAKRQAELDDEEALLALIL